MNHIAILLTVFNRKEKTIKCLRNITAQSLPADTKFDIYIVDGGSTDGTVESVKHSFPMLTSNRRWSILESRYDRSMENGRGKNEMDATMIITFG